MLIKKNKKEKGAVTLIAVLIIGLTISSIIISNSLFNRLSIINSQNFKKIKQAQYSSEACMEIALLEIYNDKNYTGSESVLDGDISCNYIVTNEGGISRKIITTSSINGLNYYNELMLTISSKIEISSWKRITNI